MNYESIADKIEDLIKKDIQKKGLIRTGAMYNSIVVTSSGDGDYDIQAVDYFKYVNGYNDITLDVFASKELSDFIEKEYIKFIEGELE